MLVYVRPTRCGTVDQMLAGPFSHLVLPGRVLGNSPDDS